jgi:hypothetical protein
MLNHGTSNFVGANFALWQQNILEIYFLKSVNSKKNAKIMEKLAKLLK